jgi:hypothetical protein
MRLGLLLLNRYLIRKFTRNLISLLRNCIILVVTDVGVGTTTIRNAVTLLMLATAATLIQITDSPGSFEASKTVIKKGEFLSCGRNRDFG